MVHVLRAVSNTLFSFLSINHITDALPMNYDVINVVKKSHTKKTQRTLLINVSNWDYLNIVRSIVC